MRKKILAGSQTRYAFFLRVLVPAKSLFKPARQIYTAHTVQLSSRPLKWQLSFLIEVQEAQGKRN